MHELHRLKFIIAHSFLTYKVSLVAYSSPQGISVILNILSGMIYIIFNFLVSYHNARVDLYVMLFLIQYCGY